MWLSGNAAFILQRTDGSLGFRVDFLFPIRCCGAPMIAGEVTMVMYPNRKLLVCVRTQWHSVVCMMWGRTYHLFTNKSKRKQTHTHTAWVPRCLFIINTLTLYTSCYKSLFNINSTSDFFLIQMETQVHYSTSNTRSHKTKHRDDGILKIQFNNSSDDQTNMNDQRSTKL